MKLLTDILNDVHRDFSYGNTYHLNFMCNSVYSSYSELHFKQDFINQNLLLKEFSRYVGMLYNDRDFMLAETLTKEWYFDFLSEKSAVEYLNLWYH